MPELEYAFDMEDEMPDASAGSTVVRKSLVTGEQGKEDSISYRLFHWKFTVEQKEEVKRAMAARVPREVILSYFYPETSVVKMMEIRRRHES